MVIAIRQNEERTIVDIELNANKEECIELFKKEMIRDYGEKRCYIEEESHSNGVSYKMYDCNDRECLKDSITILSLVKE